MDPVLILMNAVGGTALLVVAGILVFTLAIVIDAWSQGRADALVFNAVADYELRRALDKGLDNFCRECIRLLAED